jgi:protein-serine/threonine kinase
MLTDFDLSKQSATIVSPQIVKRMFSKSTDIYSTIESATTSFVGTAEYIAVRKKTQNLKNINHCIQPEVIKGFGQSSSVDWWTFGILMFEMLYGSTPYRGKSQDDTFDHILDGELKFPDSSFHSVSTTCKSLIRKLLEPDPKKRLGSVHGAADIKNHKFFEGKLNFNLIRNLSPPIIPALKGPTDTSNFRDFPEEKKELEEDNTHEEKDEEVEDKPQQSTQQSAINASAFKEFTPSNSFLFCFFVCLFFF